MDVGIFVGGVLVIVSNIFVLIIIFVFVANIVAVITTASPPPQSHSSCVNVIVSDKIITATITVLFSL